MRAHPFEFARRASTLDHISKGCIAWNIVTSTQENAARNFGFDRLTEHDERYDWVEEYSDVVYKLWEGSWDEDALPKDRASGVYVDASRIHKINHVGPRYRVEKPHLPSPSLQSTPLLFQAGSSPAGRTFVARNAEAQFILSPNPAAARELITETRAIAEHHGRLGSDIKFFHRASLIIGSEEARRKERELDAYVSVVGFLAHANLGVSQDDGRPLPEDMLLQDVRTNGGCSHIKCLRKAQPGREPSGSDLGRLVACRHPRLVSTPEQIADQLEVWHQARVDGLNIVN